jgi:hypothetical protein
MANLTTTNIPENKTANIQYSYPNASVTGANPFSLGLNQKFSASFSKNESSIYISGVCVKATITEKTHTFANNSKINAELLLEHKKSDNATFYVIVPVILTNISANPQELAPGSEFDLNSKLKKNKPMFVCYKETEGNSYVFVFENPIQINSNVSPVKTKSFNADSIFRVSMVKNVEGFASKDDEIVCEYAIDSDANATPADTTMISTIMFWVFILFGVSLCLMYSFTILSNIANKQVENIIQGVTALIGLAGLIVFIVFFVTTDKKIQYGSLSILSLTTFLIPLLAYNGYFKKPVIPIQNDTSSSSSSSSNSK